MTRKIPWNECCSSGLLFFNANTLFYSCHCLTLGLSVRSLNGTVLWSQCHLPWYSTSPCETELVQVNTRGATAGTSFWILPELLAKENNLPISSHSQEQSRTNQEAGEEPASGNRRHSGLIEGLGEERFTWNSSDVYMKSSSHTFKYLCCANAVYQPRLQWDKIMSNTKIT